MGAIRRAVALSLLFAVAACFPVTSTVPVGSTAGFKPDPMLLGVWRGHAGDEKSPAYMTFVRASDGDLSAVLVTPAGSGEDGDWEVYDLKVANLGGHRFLSARGTFANGQVVDDWPAHAVVPLLYRIEGKTLSIYALDDKAAAAAVRSHRIAGTVDPDTHGNDGKVIVTGDVHLTADGRTLDALMQSAEGLALFKRPLIVLTKIE